MRYCQRIYIKYFSNFKRTHRIDFVVVKFWKFIMLQLFIHFDMIENGGGRWCYLPNLFKQVHNFFIQYIDGTVITYWRLTIWLNILIRKQVSLEKVAGRLNEVTSFVLVCLDSICGIVFFLLRLFQ